jgi:hypothetical protein
MPAGDSVVDTNTVASEVSPLSAPTSPISGAASLMPGGSVIAPSGGMTSSFDSIGAGTATPTVMGGPKKGKKMMLIGIIVAAIIVILLSAAAAAYYVVANKPQNILNTALANSFSAKTTSMSFDGSLDIKTGGSNSVSTTFSGAANQSGAFTFMGKVDALVATLGFDLRSTDGNTFYARVSGLDGIPQILENSGSMAAMYAPMIAGVNNQWIQVNPSMIQKLTGNATTLNTKFSATDHQKLADIYKRNPFLVAQKSLPSETIKGKSSYHLQVIIDKAKLKSFAAALKSANIQNVSITQDDLTNLNKQVDQASFGKYPVDVWIAKSGKLIDQISFTNSQSGTTTSLRFTIDDYNKSVTVVAPSGAKSLLDIISNLLTNSSMSPSASLNAQNSISL